MGALPPERAGVGSAVNDTTRELGGTLGVAIAGSLVASIYSSKVAHGLAGTPVPASAVDATKDSVSAALVVAQRATEQAGPAAGALIRQVASRAYIDGFVLSSRVMVDIALVGALAAYLWLPARADTDQADVTDQDTMVDLVSAEAGLISTESHTA